MNELGLIIQNDKVVVSSRKVAETYEKEHRGVLRDIRNIIETIQEAQHNFVQSTYFNEQNREMPMYIMDRQGFSMLVMGFTGTKAKQFTFKYTKAFEDMARELEKKQSYTPQIDSRLLYQIAQQLEEKEKQIALLKPKAEFFDTVADSKDAIDIGSAAKVLNMGVGRNTLFEILRENGVLMVNNQPYQKYIDMGYFRTIEQKYTKTDGSVCINIKTLVYQKGLDYIRKLLQKQSA